MDIVISLVLALATWRVSHLIAREDGPAEILSKFRHWIGVRSQAEPPYEYGKNEFAKGIICVWCNSVWVGLFFTLLYVLWKPLWFAALPFALSACAILVNVLLKEE